MLNSLRSPSTIEEICQRRSQGDPAAIEQFDAAIAPSVRRILNRLSRTETSSSPRAQRILSRAQLLLREGNRAAVAVQDTAVLGLTRSWT